MLKKLTKTVFGVEKTDKNWPTKTVFVEKTVLNVEKTDKNYLECWKENWPKLSLMLKKKTKTDQVYFAISVSGFGSSNSPFGQIGLAAPAYIIPPHPLIANAAGEASLSIRLPAMAQGYELFVQGLELSFADGLLLSEALSGVIQ